MQALFHTRFLTVVSQRDWLTKSAVQLKLLRLVLLFITSSVKTLMYNKVLSIHLPNTRLDIIGHRVKNAYYC